LILLARSLIGVKPGVYATAYVTGMKIRFLFALMDVPVAVSVFLKQINMAAISSYFLMSAACTLCLVIPFPLDKHFFHTVLL